MLQEPKNGQKSSKTRFCSEFTVSKGLAKPCFFC
jgi:hypothetical protein